jgi:hypothetical protein
LQSRLIRVVDELEAPGRLARLKEYVQANPVTGVAGAVVGLPVAVFSAPWALGAAAVGAGAGVTAARRARGRSISEVPVKAVKRWRDERGEALTVGSTYAAHPMSASRAKALQTQFINSGTFHDHIITEQMSHIAAYLRSKVPLRTLIIDVISEKTGDIYGAVPTAKGSAGAGMTSSTTGNHSYSLELDNPVVQPPAKGELFWMRLFPEIASGIEGASKGRLVRNSRVSTSFGLKLDIAKIAGIQASWLQNRIFRIEATFG